MAITSDFRQIPLSDLFLDPENPRLPKSMHNRPEAEILEFMLLDASLIELMLAIGTNGYFQGEQLLVCPDQHGRFKVIEGNRRLSAVKLLNNPNLANVQRQKIEQVMQEVTFIPEEIPCLVFQQESDIHNYLGYRHITGVKEWKLLEKARYLTGLRQQSFPQATIAVASRQIAKMIGSRKDYVRRILVGFDVYLKIEDEGFYRIPRLDDTTFFFNYIADSLNKNNIEHFLGVDLDDDDPTANVSEENLEKWTRWLFERNDQNVTRLNGSSSDLTKLNHILGNEHATLAFENGATLDRAYELTEDLTAAFRKAVKSSISNLESADSIVHRLSEFYTDLEDDLRVIRSLTTKIKNAKDAADDERF